MATTLLDAIEYPIQELVELYDLRWQVEINLNHLKTTPGMEQLRGKTPVMVRTELYIYLSAYNLLRTLMWETGTTYKVDPLQLSIQRTRQHLGNFIPEFASASARKRGRLHQTLLETIVRKLVPKRIGCNEPRVCKRRPKAYPSMQQRLDKFYITKVVLLKLSLILVPFL